MDKRNINDYRKIIDDYGNELVVLKPNVKNKRIERCSKMVKDNKELLKRLSNR